MSTTTSLPVAIGQDQTVNMSHAAIVSRFSTLAQAQLLRVDSGLKTQDSESAETALAVLAKSAVAELRFLHVDETEDEIHLTGQVRSFYHKQLAQEAMRPIAEGRLVVNEVQVQN